MKKSVFKLKRPLAALLALILALPVSVSAEQDTAVGEEMTLDSSYDVAVVPNFEYSFIKGRATVIDTCDIVGPWLRGENAGSIMQMTSLESYPFVSVDQSGCIRVYGDGVKSGEWVSIMRTLDNGVDYSKYKNLVFTICSDFIGEGDVYAMIELRGQEIVAEVEGDDQNSEEGEEEKPFEETRRFESGALSKESWNGIVCDISDWEGAASVVEIKIGLKFVPDENESVLYNVSYNVDFFAGAESASFEREAYFMSDSYSASGTDNSVTFYDDPMTMALSISYSRAEQCSLYSGALPTGIMDNADALKIRLANYSSCSKITLEYATASQPSYKQNPAISATLDSSQNMQTVYFKLPDKNITELKLSFDSESDGIIEFYSISPASYYAPIDKRLGEAVSSEGYITSCKLDDSQNIIIRGTLSDIGASAYKGLKVQLYELEGHMSVERLFDGSLRPLKSVSAASAFSFEIPLYDGQRSRIASRFALAIYNESKNQITLLSSPSYITNPTLAGDMADATYASPSGKKGLIASPDVVAKAGASLCVVDVDIGKLFTVSENGIAYRYDGKTYYFDSDYIGQLDRSIKDMYLSKATVNLRLLLTKPTYSDFVGMLIDPSSVSRDCSYYGFSLASEASISYLSAGCSFLAQRYCRADAEYGLVSGVIVGARLDNAYRYYNVGAKNLREFADVYCRALRIVANTMRAVGGPIRVYIPLGGEWDGFSADGQYFSYYSRDLAEILAEQIRAEGNIAYGYVVDFYDLPKRALSDVNGSESLINSELGVCNLEELCAYLKKSRFTFESQSRPIIVAKAPDPLFDSVLTVSERQAKLEYILLYTAVCSDFASNVEGVVFDSSLISGEIASFVSLLRDIDTVNYASVTEYALGQYGIGDWSEIITGYKTALSPSRVRLMRAGEQTLSSDVFGTAPLWIDEAHDVSYVTGSAVIALDTGVEFNGLVSATNVYFSSNGGLKALGEDFTHQRDLTFAPIVSFNLYTDRDDTVKVVFSSALGSYEFECYVVGGRWNKVVCDLENMEGIKSIDGMTFYAGDSMQMALAGFSASSRVNDSEAILNRFVEEHKSLTPQESESVDQVLVLGLVIAIVFALSAEIVYIVIRKRRADAASKSAKRLLFGKNSR